MFYYKSCGIVSKDPSRTLAPERIGSKSIGKRVTTIGAMMHLRGDPVGSRHTDGGRITTGVARAAWDLPWAMDQKQWWSDGESVISVGKDDAVDGQRFDTWTRAFARSGSRRRLVRAVIGGGALLAASGRGLSEVAAHHGSAGPGEPCRSDNQCVAADAPMVCAWNGYGSAGQACCTGEGSNCGDDSWCCGTNVCIGGTCTSQDYGCTGEGCTCFQGTYDDNPCDPGLVCCLNADNSGTCLPQYTCTGYGLPGDDCPQYCLPGPTQCPGCISGYCAAAGVCG